MQQSSRALVARPPPPTPPHKGTGSRALRRFASNERARSRKDQTPMPELDGKVAIVTGAGRNIGRAIALALAEGGAAVVVNARANRKEADAVVREIERGGGEALAYLADVTDGAAVAAMVAAGSARFGRIDILVNNAAVRDEKSIERMTIADWRAVMAVILEGAFHCVKATLPALKQSGAGTIVNIGGLSAHTGSKHRAHVIAAKAGLIGLTRALAHDLAADRITVNCVSPGLIERPRDPALPEPAHHQVNRTLTGKYGTAEDVAAVVRFLAGPAARYLTGQTIHANGGAYLSC
jgi:3-oxoacyl-[acyl-carrier protein] reductase